MKIFDSTYRQILFSYTFVHPEQGGIIGEQDGVICKYFHDNTSQEVTNASYIPNTDLFNRQIQAWALQGIHFCGIIHSHLPFQTELSEQDKLYIYSVIHAMPRSITKLYFPIIIPKHGIYSYSVCTDQSEPPICPDKITIIPILKSKYKYIKGEFQYEFKKRTNQ